MKKVIKTKKRKPIVAKLNEPVYRFDLLFINGCPWKEAREILQKWELQDIFEDHETDKGVMYVMREEDHPKVIKGTCFFIWIREYKDFYTLLHEVTHLLIAVFDARNMDVNKFTTEPAAFYHEFWFKKLWRLMNP